jgi:hypothetical protein
MNTRAVRPLLGIALSGALLLGGAFTASPALAADATPATSAKDAPRPAAAGHTGAFVASNEPAPKPAQLVRPKLAAEDPVPGAPTGSYTLSSSAAWVGQTVQLPGTLQVNKSAVWLGEKLRVTISGVQPGFTSKIVLDWGDGYTNTFPGTSGYVDGYYYHRRVGGKRVSGLVTLRAFFYNKLGYSVVSAKVNIRPDGWRPAIKVNKPAKSNRASSWAYVRGGASDKGSGLNGTYVWVTKITGKKVYCYTPSKKWKRVYNQTQLNHCAGILAKVTKGKWSVRVLGLKKGSTVYVDALNWDWSDNVSKQSSVHAKLTK